MPRLTRRHALALLATATLATCLTTTACAERVAGSGQRTTEARAITGFEAIALEGSFTAHRALRASIAGSGDLRYGGRVQGVKTSIVGSGEVRRR